MEWISVNDRLPTNEKQKIIVYCRFYGVDSVSSSINLKKLGYTHWMPLPPPPSIKVRK